MKEMGKTLEEITEGVRPAQANSGSTACLLDDDGDGGADLNTVV
jgi:hypothetical protein